MQEQETFLVVQGHVSNLVNAFLWQGTYEALHKLPHEHFQLNTFVLMADEGQGRSALGTPLLQVVEMRPISRAASYIDLAALDLRHLPKEQRLRELERAKRILEAESQDLLVELPDTPEGNRERLKRLGIRELTAEEMDAFRR